MDLLFVEYASPFSILDGFIGTGRLVDFIQVFIKKRNERYRWNYYLHNAPYMDMDWEKFNARCEAPDPKNFQTSKEQLETTVGKSFALLGNFEI